MGEIDWRASFISSFIERRSRGPCTLNNLVKYIVCRLSHNNSRPKFKRG
jgi:hypothetical protein